MRGCISKLKWSIHYAIVIGLKMSLFIFNSEANFRKYFLFVLVFYVTYFFSFGLFIIKPSIFYWRAWEFFEELGFCIPQKLEWNGYEYGDASRRYIYSFHNKWTTQVSIDHEGFRSVPFRSDSYPIVIVGDSNTWGSGFSDEETIPWIVAKKLAVPVFNGARKPFTLLKMINNPRIKGDESYSRIDLTTFGWKKYIRRLSLFIREI